MSARKRKIGNTSDFVMREALSELFDTSTSLKSIARKYAFPRTTLRRYRAKCLANGNEFQIGVLPDDNNLPRLTPNYAVNQVFTPEEETILCSYLKQMSKLHHGLTPKHVRTLAYQLAEAHNKKMPPAWHTNQQAGRLWLNSFLKRNQKISIRKPESTAIGRAMGFNKPAVHKFYLNLETALQKFDFSPSNIYNVDEKALTTFQDPRKVTAEKGQKQVGQLTSAERGTLVTMVGCINAIGNTVPPMLIFPRKKFKAHMMKNAPPGAVGAASPTGWINVDIFLDWLAHFKSHAKPTKDAPVLLIMDSHESHVAYKILEYAKENHIRLLTLPPHTSHKLQPLDKSVYGPLKAYYNSECQKYLLNHPGGRITIYEIAELLGKSYSLAFAPKNCVSAFKNTGIFPFDRDIYGDQDFVAANVTDVPLQQEAAKKPRESTPERSMEMENVPSTSRVDPEEASRSLYFSPEAILPLPKADASKAKNNRKARRKKTSEMRTDTPIMNRILEEHFAKTEKHSGVKKKIFEDPIYKSQKTIKKPKCAAKGTKDETDSDDVSSEISYASSTVTEDLNESEENVENCDIENIEVDNFILVKFATKKSLKYYIGQVITVHKSDREYSVSFLRKNNKRFIFPTVPDVSTVSQADIVMKLSTPFSTGGTKRMLKSFVFNKDLGQYNVQ